MEIIDVKKAIQTAYSTINNYFDSRDFTDILLEEVELTDDDKYWLITISINVPIPRTTITPIDGFLGGDLIKNYTRKYKIFKIEASTGIVKSMKIREI